MTRVELPDLGRWAPQRTDAQRWEPPRKLTVVVAPHTEDETLLSGGLIAHQARAGVPVIVLAVTDGEAAPIQATRTGSPVNGVGNSARR